MNVVPCGPSANTTPSYPIIGRGPNHGTSPVLNCGGGVPGDGGSPTDVRWVSFIIQAGGSFEWQTVAGGDDFYWVMYVSQTPNPNTLSAAGACMNLLQVDCGVDFNGWRIQTTPNPNTQWRFYIAYYLRNGDQNGDGVVKIRKSCGLGCIGSSAVATAGPDVCVTPGSNVGLTSTTSDPPSSSLFWLETPDNNTLSSNIISNPTASNILVTTVYEVTIVGADGCPATASTIVSIGSCCDADAGDITPFGPLNSCESSTSLDATNFTAASGSGASTLDYALILVDMDGIIKLFDATSTYNFLFSTLGGGMYFVYALSYDQVQESMSISDYLTPQIGMNIIDIQDDIDNGICADLLYGGIDNKITIAGPNCGTFPGN